MSDEKKVLEHLIQEHTGRHNAIRQSKLAKSLDIPESTLRSVLRRLREERNIPIGNMRDGYFVIQDKEELQEYIGHINQEIQSKRNTIEHTLEAFEEFEGDISVNTEAEVKERMYDCAKCGGSVAQSKRKYARQGDYQDKPLCKGCYGELVMAGEA